MKQILQRLSTLVLLAAMFTVAGYAGSKDYYAKATAISSAEGKVYVTAGGKAPASTEFLLEHSLIQSQSASSAPTINFYLHASPEVGYSFTYWTDEQGNQVSTDNPAIVSITATSESESSPTAQSWTAHYETGPSVIVESTLYGGTASISVPENKIGDQVTIKAEIPRLQTGNIYVPNNTLRFINWLDQDGNVFSTEPEVTFTIERNLKLIANFKALNEMPRNGKYYRIYHFLGRYLSVEGAYSITLNTLKGTQVPKSILRWDLPDDYDVANFTLPGISSNGKYFFGSDNGAIDENGIKYTEAGYTGTLGIDITSDPSNIFFVEGTDGEDALTNASLSAQGVKTSDIMKDNFVDVTPCIGTFANFVNISSSTIKQGGIKANTPWDEDNPTGSTQASLGVYIGEAANNEYLSAISFEPIDEEHLEYHWFGAAADESMFFDGAYWTTMYTGFPYECRDGVEAYYANAVAESEGVSYIRIEKIESGIVPASTPVILKCQGTDSKQNRLLPLAPDASYTPVEGNMLAGEFQLYTDQNRNGRKLYDSETMRVFGVNSSGEVGFYRLAAKPDGSARELAANRAYLDLTKLPASAQGVRSFRIIDGDNTNLSGIDVLEDQNDTSMPEEYYTLEGIRVKTPIRGNLYIVRQGRTAKKIIY